ncbi:hypothetical protein SARC_07696 [Sphaeroforma arctica JP610]|uniref:Peptidase M20 dimerisation domain-containing protein n=1 Tax=Sphaeroforma arctica JP610 TaxID=667725 RepID=A0A0L0FT07_9EUKA|nr:hypothetical protein SARC_07696 [Sphaeroforma arctica JP610]KNC79925.1 hypothetical protein SARC_07696 [Sphaeroforma arctica JP610]|eukprot:XP_014153827.1 hypothetical protein SARC_07696 [Sphaeroforma arctica JP610]
MSDDESNGSAAADLVHDGSSERYSPEEDLQMARAWVEVATNPKFNCTGSLDFWAHVYEEHLDLCWENRVHVESKGAEDVRMRFAHQAKEIDLFHAVWEKLKSIDSDGDFDFESAEMLENRKRQTTRMWFATKLFNYRTEMYNEKMERLAAEGKHAEAAKLEKPEFLVQNNNIEASVRDVWELLIEIPEFFALFTDMDYEGDWTPTKFLYGDHSADTSALIEESGEDDQFTSHNSREQSQARDVRSIHNDGIANTQPHPTHKNGTGRGLASADVTELYFLNKERLEALSYFQESDPGYHERCMSVYTKKLVGDVFDERPVRTELPNANAPPQPSQPDPLPQITVTNSLKNATDDTSQAWALLPDTADEDVAVTALRNYLRISPIHKYTKLSRFLRREADRIGLQYAEYEPVPGQPVIVLTLLGRDPSQESVLLNSHTDTGTLDAQSKRWTHPPYVAHKDSQGRIYAHGAQDKKCVGMQYLHALARILSNHRQASTTPLFHRTLHLSYVSGLEVGGGEVMANFVDSEAFNRLGVGFALDAGLACASTACDVYVGERAPYWLTLTAHGTPGHGSVTTQKTAPLRLNAVINRFLEVRSSEAERMQSHGLSVGDVMSINLTMVHCGVQHNAIPATASAGFDIRAPPSRTQADVHTLVESLLEEGVTVDYVLDTAMNNVTTADDSSPWWTVFAEACNNAAVKLNDPGIFPAGTDARFLRSKGIPTIGFSPINNTIAAPPEQDEYIDEQIYLRGVTAFEHIFAALGDMV